jgi:hypothetical protein
MASTHQHLASTLIPPTTIRVQLKLHLITCWFVPMHCFIKALGLFPSEVSVGQAQLIAKVIAIAGCVVCLMQPSQRSGPIRRTRGD